MTVLRKLLGTLGLWQSKDAACLATPPNRDDMEFAYRSMAR
jgi:hypothetical protein